MKAKPHNRLPDLSPEQEQLLQEAMEEIYAMGVADAKEQLCSGCAYKKYYARLAAQGDCNDCAKARTCQYVPKPGGIVRINCPLWRARIIGG